MTIKDESVKDLLYEDITYHVKVKPLQWEEIKMEHNKKTRYYVKDNPFFKKSFETTEGWGVIVDNSAMIGETDIEELNNHSVIVPFHEGGELRISFYFSTEHQAKTYLRKLYNKKIMELLYLVNNNKGWNTKVFKDYGEPVELEFFDTLFSNLICKVMKYDNDYYGVSVNGNSDPVTWPNGLMSPSRKRAKEAFLEIVKKKLAEEILQVNL